MCLLDTLILTATKFSIINYKTMKALIPYPFNHFSHPRPVYFIKALIKAFSLHLNLLIAFF